MSTIYPRAIHFLFRMSAWTHCWKTPPVSAVGTSYSATAIWWQPLCWMLETSAWCCFMPHITHTCMAFLTHSTVVVFFFHPEPRLEYLTYLRKFYPSSKFEKYNRPTRTINKKESRLRVWNMTYRIMHESQCITILGSRVRWFANNFHELRNHGKECIILFLTRYFISWAYTI